MRTARLVVAAAAAWLVAAPLSASGPLGIYGIVDKVVFEPGDQAPQRVQVWGAFAYVDGGDGGSVSAARRGYLYFTLPQRVAATPRQVELIRREWADLKAVAGTGQAVGFGRWGYVGWFGGLSPDTLNVGPPYALERAPQGGAQTDLRVRPASERPANPAAYETNTGVVKLTDGGSHAAIIKELRDARDR